MAVLSGLPEVFTHESEQGWWRMQVGRPAAVLRGDVRCYIGYQENSRVPVRRREVPSGDVTLVLSFGPPIDVLDASGTRYLHRVTSFVAPVDDASAVTEYSGEQHGLEVVMTPLGASRLLGMPMSELTGLVIDIEDLLGRQGPLLVERLAEQEDWPSRFAVVDGLLAGMLERGRTASPAAAFAWRRLRETEGGLPIRALVDELGCSHRYLVSEFRAHVGVTPKTFARVLRGRRALRMLDAGRAPAAVAADCGFSDQAHLNRDFRRLTGISPSAWLAERSVDLPSL